MEKLKSVVTTSPRLYMKIITSADVNRLAELYVHDSYNEFDSIKEAFDEKKIMNKDKLRGIIKERIADYDKIKISRKHKFSRVLLYTKNSHEAVGMVGFDSMDIRYVNPLTKDAKQYDISKGAIVIIYKIHPFHCRKGYATEGVGTMLKWFFDNTDNKQIIANIFMGNIGSQKVARNLGFRPIYQYQFSIPDFAEYERNPQYDAECYALKKQHLIIDNSRFSNQII